MKKYLIEDVYEKYMHWRKDSKEMQDIDRRSFNQYLDKSMDRSYYSERNEKFALEYINVFNSTLTDFPKLEKMCNEKPEFIKEYMRNCLAGLKFCDTFKYPMAFRKLLVDIVDKSHMFLFLQNKEDFEALYESMWQKISYDSNNSNPSPIQKKVLVINDLFDSVSVQNKIESKHMKNMPFKQIMEIYLDTFNLDKKQVVELNTDYFYNQLAKTLFGRIQQNMDPYQSEALKEWDEELSDEDKEFISKITLKRKIYKLDNNYGFEYPDQIEYFKRFKSFDILEAFTFVQSSNSAWWKEKSILSNAFAVWYGCAKGQIPKYVQNKFGKFKPLISLYGYNWKKIREIILKDQEVIKALQ